MLIEGARRRPAKSGGPQAIHSMSSPDSLPGTSEDCATHFTTTHWSVVLATGAADSAVAGAALEKLCRAYWRPLYAYVRRSGHDIHLAEDLTQDFFARLLERRAFADVESTGGRFRSYLLTALKHFLANEWRRAQAEKRGRGMTLLSLDELDPEGRRLQPADGAAPDVVFDRRWAATVLDQSLHRLKSEFTGDGKAAWFEALQPCLTGADDALPYAEVARRLKTTEAAIKMAVRRLRLRYGELLRLEVAHTVASPQDIDEELRYLITAAAGRA
jgi:RNA polymerase sigma-70 factor (ECF subfamily)